MLLMMLRQHLQQPHPIGGIIISGIIIKNIIATISSIIRTST